MTGRTHRERKNRFSTRLEISRNRRKFRAKYVDVRIERIPREIHCSKRKSHVVLRKRSRNSARPRNALWERETCRHGTARTRVLVRPSCTTTGAQYYIIMCGIVPVRLNVRDSGPEPSRRCVIGIISNRKVPTTIAGTCGRMSVRAGIHRICLFLSCKPRNVVTSGNVRGDGPRISNASTYPRPAGNGSEKFRCRRPPCCYVIFAGSSWTGGKKTRSAKNRSLGAGDGSTKSTRKAPHNAYTSTQRPDWISKTVI